MNRLLALLLASAALVLSAVAAPLASAQDDPNAIPAPTTLIKLNLGPSNFRNAL